MLNDEQHKKIDAILQGYLQEAKDEIDDLLGPDASPTDLVIVGISHQFLAAESTLPTPLVKEALQIVIDGLDRVEAEEPSPS